MDTSSSLSFIANAYNDNSNTPTLERNREDSKERSPQGSAKNPIDVFLTATSSSLRPWEKASKGPGKSRGSTADAKDCDSDSSASDDDSASDDGKAPGAHSGSSDSSHSSSSSESERSGSSKKSPKEKEVLPVAKDRKTSSSSKVSSKRSRSRSGSKGRKQRRSSPDKRRRSRSRDRHHKTSSRSERRSGHRRSRSRSRSKDRHSSRRHSRDHRRRDNHHRRRRSSSRDGHRHRRRSSPSRRRRHRSRTPERRRGHHSEKKKRSRSPQPSCSSKLEESAGSCSTPGGAKPPVHRVAGVKFGRGRGTSSGNITFKDNLKVEFCAKLQKAEDVVFGKSQPLPLGGTPQQTTSSVATVSAGVGVMGSGGMDQFLQKHVAAFHQQNPQIQPLMQAGSYMPGQPGVLTPQQREINQRYILQTTGRSREQVEAQVGVKIPDFYNENNNNLLEVALREKKKKSMWNRSDKTEANSAFKATPMLPGQTKSENHKYARLLGCFKGKPKEEPKEEEEEEEEKDEEKRKAEEEALHKSEEYFYNLEKEFNSSRMHTHVNRGMGLGYTTTMYQPR